MMRVVILLLAVLSCAVKSQRYDFKCGQDGKPFPLLTKTDKLYLCLHWMPYEVKFGVPIGVDEHTILEVPDSFEFISAKAPENTIIFAQLDSNSFYSEGQTYSIRSQKIVNNVMQLIITLQEGVLTGMRWDNDCYGCRGTQECKNIKTTFIDFQTSKSKEISYNTCTMNYCGDGADRHICNLKIFIAWEGTDYNGNYLVSRSLMLPNFQKQNYLDMFANQRKVKYEKDPKKRSTRDITAQQLIDSNNK